MGVTVEKAATEIIKVEKKVVEINYCYVIDTYCAHAVFLWLPIVL